MLEQGMTLTVRCSCCGRNYTTVEAWMEYGSTQRCSRCVLAGFRYLGRDMELGNRFQG